MASKKADTTKYKAVLADIASGLSVRKACEAHGVKLSTFVQNVDGEQYARARSAQADAHFEEMADLEEQCRQGLLDPHVFRAMMDSRKWRLARMRPRKYGDRVAMEHSGTIATMTQEQIDAIYRATGARGK